MYILMLIILILTVHVFVMRNLEPTSNTPCSFLRLSTLDLLLCKVLIRYDFDRWCQWHSMSTFFSGPVRWHTAIRTSSDSFFSPVRSFDLLFGDTAPPPTYLWRSFRLVSGCRGKKIEFRRHQRSEKNKIYPIVHGGLNMPAHPSYIFLHEPQ